MSVADSAVAARDDLPRAVAAIEARVSELTDLFRRRLLDDRDKARAFARLSDELDFARDSLRRQVIAPLINDLILVVDRMNGTIDGGPVAVDTLSSFRDELLAVLARQGVEQVPPSEHFDARLAEAVDGRVAPDVARVGTIAEQHRPAYRWNELIFRPAQVTVWIAPESTDQLAAPGS